MVQMMEVRRELATLVSILSWLMWTKFDWAVDMVAVAAGCSFGWCWCLLVLVVVAAAADCCLRDDLLLFCDGLLCASWDNEAALDGDSDGDGEMDLDGDGEAEGETLGDFCARLLLLLLLASLLFVVVVGCLAIMFVYYVFCWLAGSEG